MGTRALIRAIRCLHMAIPYSQLRTARFVLRRLGEPIQMKRSLFGYQMNLNLHRSTGHVLLYLEGEGFLDDTLILEHLVQPGMTVVDIGASIGHLTLFFSSRIGATGRVISFEPGPENFKELSDNIRLNDLHNCTPYQLAAGAADGTLLFCSGANGHVGGGKSALSCRVVSLDSFTNDKQLLRPHLVKIDVEGFELEVLRGMSRLLESDDRPILFIELHPLGLNGIGDPFGVLSFLERFYDQIDVYRPVSYIMAESSALKRLIKPLLSKRAVLNLCRSSTKEIRKAPDQLYQLICLPARAPL